MSSNNNNSCRRLSPIFVRKWNNQLTTENVQTLCFYSSRRCAYRIVHNQVLNLYHISWLGDLTAPKFSVVYQKNKITELFFQIQINAISLNQCVHCDCRLYFETFLEYNTFVEHALTYQIVQDSLSTSNLPNNNF